MIKNKIQLYGFLFFSLMVVIESYAGSMVSLPGAVQSSLSVQSPVREQVERLFDEKKYLQDKLAYERGYNHLQEIVKKLLLIIKQKYSFIINGKSASLVTKNPKLIFDYSSGRFLKNILMQK